MQTYVVIHALYTHTCTTKYHQNIRYTQLAFALYSMKHQVIMRDLCWIGCFCCFSVKSTVLFSEKCSLMKSAVLFMKSAMLYSEKHNSMNSAALISEKHNSMKSTVLFSENRNEKCKAFQWKVQCFSVKSTTPWKTPLFTEKCSTFHSAFQQYFMSFWVTTKYRSFNERPIINESVTQNTTSNLPV